jgi:antitoxin ParD1/3/4
MPSSASETDMATMNISLPDPMKRWAEAQTHSGRYSNVSDYVRDLIRRDQETKDKIARMQHLVNEGRASGMSGDTMDDIRARVLGQTGQNS